MSRVYSCFFEKILTAGARGRFVVNDVIIVLFSSRGSSEKVGQWTRGGSGPGGTCAV